jgi:hypothetical protein
MFLAHYMLTILLVAMYTSILEIFINMYIKGFFSHRECLLYFMYKLKLHKWQPRDHRFIEALMRFENEKRY